jgi:Fe-S-cluster-containing dehydrogenase component
MAKAILFDASKCTGCRACQVACKSWNERTYTHTWCDGTYENPLELTSQCWMRILFNEPEEVKSWDELWWHFTKYQCMHCTEATCVKVCPSGATAKHKVSDGDKEAYVVMTDPDKCIGCNYCVATCPFSACRYDAAEKGIFRCRLCFDRITQSPEAFQQGDLHKPLADFQKLLEDPANEAWLRNKPACVSTCTSGALSFGEREEMVKKAEARAKELGGKARVYGKEELGGLHYIYVLQDEPETYGLPANPTVPAGVSIWEALVKPGAAWGGIGLVGMAAAAGVSYVIAKRNQGLERKEG